MVAGHMRRAALANVVAARRIDGSYPADAIERAASAAGVTTRQVRRWLKAHEPQLDEGGLEAVRSIPDPQARTGWQVTKQVLAAVAAAKTLKQAWTDLRAVDADTPSYPAFTAALRNYADNGLSKSVKGDGAPTLLRNRMYLKVDVDCRNQRWELDTQEAPVFVIPTRGTKPLKVQQTTIVDSKSRMVMATIFTPGPPTAQEVAACIAQAVYGRPYLLDGREVWVGGIPDAIVFDNAKTNLSEIVTELCVALQTLGTPVTPYAGWEKGKIESWHWTSQVECYSTMPGYTEGPKSFTGKKYWGDYNTADGLLTEALLIAQAERWAFEQYNTRRIHGQLGVTPLQAWAADTTPLRAALREQLMPAMMTTRQQRTVNKNGIRLDGVDYVAAELNRLVGRKVTVKYLPNLELERLFIEVFDRNKFICTAYPAGTLTAAQRTELLAERRKQYDLLRAVEEEAARMRRARGNRAVATNGEDTTYGQNASSFAEDDLAANTTDLFDDAPSTAGSLQPNGTAGDTSADTPSDEGQVA